MTLNSMLSNRKVFLVSGKRTPFGKFGGSLKDISPVDLAVHATKATLEEAKISAEKVDHFVLGNVVPTNNRCSLWWPPPRSQSGGARGNSGVLSQ